MDGAGDGYYLNDLLLNVDGVGDGAAIWPCLGVLPHRPTAGQGQNLLENKFKLYS